MSTLYTSTPEILVVGGGPSGVCAALGAARTGSKVMLLERAGFLGGTATGGMVAAFNGFFWNECQVTGGIAADIVDRLIENGGSDGFRNYTAGELTGTPMTFKVLPFDPEILKLTLDDLMLESGVQVVHHAQAIDVEVNQGRVHGLTYVGPVEVGRIACQQVVDTTGHGTIAIRAGGREVPNDRAKQPMTLMVRVSGVDHQRLDAIGKDARRAIVRAGVDGERLFYRTLAMSTSPRNADTFLLMTAVHGRDGTDPFDLSAAEIEGRHQVRSTVRYLRDQMPGFERAEIAQLAPWIGVRETRRVLGHEVLSAAAVIDGWDSPAAVSYGAGPIDHHENDNVRLLAPARPFAVPYGVLCPRGVDNVLVAGRAVSAEAGAMDGLRHMGGVMPLGHAAGVAASLASTGSCTPADVGVDTLRAALRAQGAVLDLPVQAGSTLS